VALLGANYGETNQNETIQHNETAIEHRQLSGLLSRSLSDATTAVLPPGPSCFSGTLNSGAGDEFLVSGRFPKCDVHLTGW
jgi:hypothetical protein